MNRVFIMIESLEFSDAIDLNDTIFLFSLRFY